MTVHKSAQRINSDPARATAGECILTASVTTAVAVATSDTVEFFTAPAGFRVCEVILTCTDIDTNATPTVTINVGDAGDADRFISASTIGQAGGIDRMDEKAGHLYEFTADTVIVAALATVATGAVGTIALSMIGTFSDN